MGQTAAGGIKWKAIQRDQVYDYHLLFLVLSSRRTQLKAKFSSLIPSSHESFTLAEKESIVSSGETLFQCGFLLYLNYV